MKHIRAKSRPSRPANPYVCFIGPNPPVSFNASSVWPNIDPTAFIGPFSTVIGDVTIEGNVFVAPNVTIRADEGHPFYIGRSTNLQDGVIVHGLAQGRVVAGGKEYSVYIGKNASCAHGCIVHGPCFLGDDVFVGFRAIVYSAVVGAGAFISHNALVTGGVSIAPGRFVPSGAIIDTQAKADALEPVTESQNEFAGEVRHVNGEFPEAYLAQFGSVVCSCGMAF